MFAFDNYNREQIEIIENNRDGYRGLFVVNGDELLRAWNQLRNYAEVYQRDVLPFLALEKYYEPTDAQPLFHEVPRLYAGGWGYNVRYRPSDKHLAWFQTAREQAKAWMEVVAANFPQTNFPTGEPRWMKVGLFHLEWTAENNEPRALGDHNEPQSSGQEDTINRMLSLLNGVGAPEDLKLQPYLNARAKNGANLTSRSRHKLTLQSLEQFLRSLREPSAEGKVKT